MKCGIGFVTLLAVAGSNAWLWPWQQPDWNGLKTTFALDGLLLGPVPDSIYESTGYAKVPRTLTDEKASSWKKLNDADDCENGGKFNGFRYFEERDGALDTSVSVLFDSQGSIAGIQMNIPVSEAKANGNTYKFDDIPMFLPQTINGVDFYTLTSYFIDPSMICSTGRDPATIERSGSGTGLYFQNGTSPANNFQAPMNRQDALATGDWSNNQCFPGMGVHNWYRQEHFDDDDCNTVLPVFLLYTKQNKLIGFGFQHVGKSNARRFEHPSATAVKLIVGPTVSKCLLEKAGGIGVTTMHVFLIDSPLSQNCVI